jgi:hypothetical protein
MDAQVNQLLNVTSERILAMTGHQPAALRTASPPERR